MFKDVLLLQPVVISVTAAFLSNQNDVYFLLQMSKSKYSFN